MIWKEGFNVEVGEEEAKILQEINLETRAKETKCPSCDEYTMVVKYPEGDSREGEREDLSSPYLNCIICGYQEVI